jgi:membrane protease YdiL (CAAX protease family)
MSDMEQMLVQPPAEVEPPLTGAVIAPAWALIYAAGVLLLNVLLQFASRSEAVLAPLRVLLSSVAAGSSARFLAVAALSATITVASYALMLIPAVAVAVVAHRRGVRFSEAVGLRAFPVGRTVGLALAVVVGGFLATAVYASAAASLGISVQGNTADLVSGFGAGPLELIMVFGLVGVVAPFVEEITFRGIVFPSLREAWGTTPALLVSGAVFGVVHLQPTIALPLALIGIALAVVFLRTRSLWSAIIAHCAYNSVALALAFAVASQAR